MREWNRALLRGGSGSACVAAQRHLAAAAIDVKPALGRQSFRLDLGQDEDLIPDHVLSWCVGRPWYFIVRRR